MNAEQKQRAKDALTNWLVDDMAALLQELVDAPEPEPFGYFKPEPFGWTDCAETDDGAIALYTAPSEPEPVARVTGYYAGHTTIITLDGRVLPAGTALYAAPPHQSEHHLEMVNTPAPSVQDGWKHDCAGILQNDVELWVDSCPHCGKPRPAAPTQAEAPADVVRDAARLDWLDDRNAPHGLGWEIIQMPAGNVHIHTLTGDKAKFGSIRDAIDAAIERQGARDATQADR